ncbi:hypothetical protein [Paenibacillus cremeus]|uniref:Uncharacterized protein n=1 Tax=Paenibacillus cremeus TaxID=2163881 RepID=A0A559KGK9_9BACL|nr:hypothetical protein [Paenibacillus cremeus]TVY11269.1 hypothetical protein FPZ49_03275 [Paenibacillus cremeus]
MIKARAIPWLGMICLLAGLSRMGMTPSSLIWGTDSLPELTCGIVASILMTVGTLAVYLVQSREIGTIGFISVLGIMIGNIAITFMLWSAILSIDPASPPDGAVFTLLHLLALIGLTGGTLLFTILSYRANVFPRWVIVLLVMMHFSMVLPVGDNKYFAFFWGLAYVGMGYTVWAGRLNPSKKNQTTSVPK